MSALCWDGRCLSIWLMYIYIYTYVTFNNDHKWLGRWWDTKIMANIPNLALFGVDWMVRWNVFRCNSMSFADILFKSGPTDASSDFGPRPCKCSPGAARRVGWPGYEEQFFASQVDWNMAHWRLGKFIICCHHHFVLSLKNTLETGCVFQGRHSSSFCCFPGAELCMSFFASNVKRSLQLNSHQKTPNKNSPPKKPRDESPGTLRTFTGSFASDKDFRWCWRLKIGHWVAGYLPKHTHTHCNMSYHFRELKRTQLWIRWLLLNVDW